jgi:formamidopyrimidine-DNA glycosylase
VPLYKAFTVSKAWPPKFTKVMIMFEDGTQLAFVDSRRLGKIRLREDPANTEPISALALDPIHDEVTTKHIHDTLQRLSAPIKAVLLDQEKVCKNAA